MATLHNDFPKTVPAHSPRAHVEPRQNSAMSSHPFTICCSRCLQRSEKIGTPCQALILYLLAKPARTFWLGTFLGRRGRINRAISY